MATTRDPISRADIAEIWEALGTPNAELARELAEEDRPDAVEYRRRVHNDARRFARAASAAWEARGQ